MLTERIRDCLSIKEVARVKRLSYFGLLHRVWLPKRMSVAVIAFNQRVGRRRRRFIDKGDLSIRNLVLKYEMSPVISVNENVGRKFS